MKYLSVTKYFIARLSEYISKSIVVAIVFAVLVTVAGGMLVLKSRAGLGADGASDSRTNTTSYTAEDFAIELPAGLAAHEYPRDDGQDVLTFESSDETTGFQVFTMPVNEALPATAEELQAGLPEMLIEDFRNGSVGGVPAISFNSYDEDIGDTFEVWFVHDALLYQVMTYRPLEGWLSQILPTWRWR